MLQMENKRSSRDVMYTPEGEAGLLSKYLLFIKSNGAPNVLRYAIEELSSFKFTGSLKRERKREQKYVKKEKYTLIIRILNPKLRLLQAVLEIAAAQCSGSRLVSHQGLESCCY
ncbi:hypothetical protein TNCV_3533981 [Trichonephila clavipes]|nr:hypothetical protein TNCV_3533981 [Trichonephila clavipes]